MDNQFHNYEKVEEWINKEKKIINDQDKVLFLHDTWCAYLYGKHCNCFPDVAVNGEKIKWPKSLLEG